jgi:transcriptional regulator with XRE-family HTH domain
MLAGMMGDRLRRLRHSLALSIDGFADLLEVTGRTVTRWESARSRTGPRGATLVFLRALEDACDRDPRFPSRLREWAPLGQFHVLRKLVDESAA